ncbi:MAG: RsmB/NOP family class I SAM-dependent RNA methyltransferase [Deferrisomatales bacterium]|nr:RsmB/NOP family class I SAM-dependent RNA methyltransferase [Deferrisomatales bacterium]
MSRLEALFARYGEIVPDFPAFLEAQGRPAPPHGRVNTLKAAPGCVTRALAADGWEAEAEPWCPVLLRLRPAGRGSRGGPALGTTLSHALGHLYLQSASSALAALALGALPGERVLDLCAAPGSKTTFLAQVMEDRGCVVANEPSAQRAKSLLANLERLGVTSAVVTAYSGQNFPQRHRFHRVLVDAPCTGEGTWRGGETRPRRVKAGFREYLARQQGALLRRGYDVLEPGGTLVYSTCTYAPEENEGVVGPFLEETGARVEPFPVDVPGEPGLAAWEGRRFPPELALARRLYPHRFDSEGFFVVRLAKP